MLQTTLEWPEPAIAIPFTHEVSDADLLGTLEYVDVAEFRADYFQDGSVVEAVRVAEKIGYFLPLLVTIRHISEAGGNGGWTGTEAERLSWFTKLEPLAGGFDVELKAGILGGVIDLAKDNQKIVIASHHDFAQTPSRSELEDLLGHSDSAGADYFKVAAPIKDQQEYDRLGDFTEEHKDDGVIVVGMGEEFGPRSRVEFPFRGSRLTYAAGINGSTAAGQLGYVETWQRINEFAQEHLQSRLDLV